MPFLKRCLLGGLAFGLAAGLWLPSLHLFFRPAPADYQTGPGLSPLAQSLAARHLALWTDPALRTQAIAQMRRSNAEWDFMARTFFVLALANMSLRDRASQAQYLEIMDVIITETLRLEQEQGQFYFLMSYARSGTFRSTAGRSLFVDGEIALMLGARRLVEEKADYQPLLAERVDAMVASMQESPVLSGESYPNEAWTFCNTTALAAIRVQAALDGTDHSEFIRRWVSTAQTELVDPKTGLLVSSYTFEGTFLDGPEGSSIWMATHNLLGVDRAFAADQYQRARALLGRTVLGFGYAREWPASWVGPTDVDSGPIVPILGMSPGASGLAVLGAGAFNDTDYLAALLTSLNFGGFPIREAGQLRYAASNTVGDAVLLYALVQGPLWDEVDRRLGETP